MSKLSKTIIVCSNGSLSFSYCTEISEKNKKVIFKNLDEKNFDAFLKKSSSIKTKNLFNKKYLT